MLTDAALVAMIRRAIGAQHLTQQDVGDVVGRSQSWCGMYLLQKPGATLRRLFVDEPDRFDALVDALGFSRPSMLAAIGVPLHAPAAEVPLPRAVPVHSASDTRPLEDMTPTEWVSIPASAAHPAPLVGLRAADDRMAPYLSTEDVAVVLLDPHAARPGAFVAAFVPGHGHVFGRLVSVPDGMVVLETLNPDRPGERWHTLPGNAHVIGPVVQRILQG